MMRLINAALDYKQALESLIDFIKTEPNPSYQLLQFASTEARLERPSESLLVLTLEYQHFQKNATRNDRLAKREATKRREAGVIPRRHTPRDSILQHKGRYLPLALIDPNQSAPLSDDLRLKALEEGATANTDYESEGYCPACGVNVNEYECPKKNKCLFWQKYWNKREQKDAEEEDSGNLSL